MTTAMRHATHPTTHLTPAETVWDLSPRQLEVAIRRASGQTRQEIGAAMGLSGSSVKRHLNGAALRAMPVGPHSELRLVLWVWRKLGDPAPVLRLIDEGLPL